MSEDDREDSALPPCEKTPPASKGKSMRKDVAPLPLGRNSGFQDLSAPLTRSDIPQIVSVVAAAFQKASSEASSRPSASSLPTSQLETSMTSANIAEVALN